MADLLGLIGLLLANAFLATIRTVFANVSANGLEQGGDNDNAGVRLVRLLLEDPTRLHLTFRLLQMLTRLLFAGGLALLLLPELQRAGPLLVALLSVAVTLSLLVVGELDRKSVV